MAKLEVAFSPDLYPFYENKEAIVVVIDIFRATSAICTAFENGVKSIIPVEKVEDAKALQNKGYIAAAERQGQIVDGFHLGNSPFHYIDESITGKEVVLTTTNGTRAIFVAKNSYKIIIGSFLNFSAVCDYLKQEKKDVLLLCAGWKGRFNLEDSLFAGAVVNQLEGDVFNELSDSARATQTFYEVGKSDIDDFLINSSHRRRLKNLNLEKDIKYCLQMDQTKVVPELKGDRLVVQK
ncbi:MAG: 2-phosphosulfolactate phosphatase [Crocinitomicaceae bacterium]|nr:2-phosphosulfolactate phosphatase [Crocinitomicaceae bacterium]|tara:strand:+ start:3528 stop:4238 length:711 start_codon:yes stop_codon:yes gene_type:complete